MWFAERDSDLIPLSEHGVERETGSKSGCNLMEGELEFTPSAACPGFPVADSPRGKWIFPAVPVSV